MLRKYRGTTQSLLRFTQTVLTGFSENKVTLATFIDMEKAFDSVWRDGLLVKLYERGANGTQWEWIANFLHDKSATCIIKSKPGESFQTELGLPQGSVLSPLLFNIFLSDIYSGVVFERVKFALWTCGIATEELGDIMNRDL